MCMPKSKASSKYTHKSNYRCGEWKKPFHTVLTKRNTPLVTSTFIHLWVNAIKKSDEKDLLSTPKIN